MPVDNRLFGVWKKLSVKNPLTGLMIPIVVESVTEKAQQDISVYKAVQGTAMPRILNIGGAIATIDIVSPLLVGPAYRSSNDQYPDGLYLWSMWFRSTVMSGFYNADPGLIMSKASFSCNADGAKYSVQLMGDANSIYSETGVVADSWFAVEGWTDDNGPSPNTIPPDTGPYRVATFYDVQAHFGPEGSSYWPASQYIEDLTISMEITTDQFTYVGAEDQRKVMGVSGLAVNFSGTMIHEERMPAGDEFGWQALTNVSENKGFHGNSGGTPTDEGRAGSVTGGLQIYLRQGLPGVSAWSILPGIIDSGLLNNVVFSTSSLNIGPGLLKTKFEGQAWIDKNALVITA